MTKNSLPAASKPTLVLALVLGTLPGLFLLVTSTTHLVEGQFVYDVKRMLQLCLMLVLFLAATLNSRLRYAFALQLGRIPTWVKSLLGLIIVLGIVSSAVNATSTMHLTYSLLEVALLSLLVLAVLVIAACRAVAGELFDQVAITLLAMTAIAVGIQELLGVAAALANDLEFFFRISLMHFSWPRFYNQVQSWTLPVLAALPLVWSHSRSELLRSTWFQAFVCLSALALHWYIILMTGGRGVALSLLASFVICLLVFPATRRPTLRWHVPGLAAGVLLFLAVAALNEHGLERNQAEATPEVAEPNRAKAANPEDWYSKEDSESRFFGQSMSGRLTIDSSGRSYMWKASLRDIESHALLGVGPMNYACTGPVSRAGHPHNFALQFAGEWGGPAMLALVSILIFVAFGLWKSVRSPDQSAGQLTGLLAAGLIAAAGYSFLSGVMVMPASQVTGILVGGWLMGLVPAAPQKRIPGSAALSAMAAAIVISIATASFSFVEMGERELREAVIPNMDQGIPRYWQQGKICKYFDKYPSPE